jgi:hypothetical protein
MKELGLFLFGIIFYELIFPTLEELFGWIMAIIKVKQGKTVKEYTQLQKDIVDIQKNMAGEDKNSTFAMGFQINNPEEEEKWEEEEDE